MSSLKKYRKLAEKSQSELGDITGFSQSTISHYEKKQRIPSISSARKIVLALNTLGVSCSLDDVFPG